MATVLNFHTEILEALADWLRARVKAGTIEPQLHRVRRVNLAQLIVDETRGKIIAQFWPADRQREPDTRRGNRMVYSCVLSLSFKPLQIIDDDDRTEKEDLIIGLSNFIEQEIIKGDFTPPAQWGLRHEIVNTPTINTEHAENFQQITVDTVYPFMRTA